LLFCSLFGTLLLRWLAVDKLHLSNKLFAVSIFRLAPRLGISITRTGKNDVALNDLDGKQVEPQMDTDRAKSL
jgi:hypothetical protein